MPCDRSLYPPDWDEIALDVKNEVGWICQGCGRPCKRPGQSWEEFFCEVLPAGSVVDKPRQYVLTVAHLNHQPLDCRRANLRALCTVCHLQYDASFIVLKRRLKLERRGQLTLSLS